MTGWPARAPALGCSSCNAWMYGVWTGVGISSRTGWPAQAPAPGPTPGCSTCTWRMWGAWTCVDGCGHADYGHVLMGVDMQTMDMC
eukprot:363976-Chlamydomonas_euryale.AAC.2